MTNSIIEAAILPPGRTQFFDTNGNPLAGGSVYFYIPNTNTLKDTWQDPYENTLNTNPVILDASGSALIYGSGQYTMSLYDSLNNLIYTALTSDGFIGTSGSLLLFLWCGTGTGGPNTYSVSPNPALPGPTIPTGTPLAFISSGTSGSANTGPSTLSITNISASPIPIKKIGFAGLENLRGGEIYDGAICFGIYDGTQIVLLGNGRNAEGTTFCGTSSGSSSAQVLTPAGITSVDTGQIFTFLVGAGLTNTGNVTIQFTNTGTTFALYKNTPNGRTQLTGGEICENQLAICVWDGADMQLLNPFPGVFTTKVSTTQSPTIGNNNWSYIASGAFTLNLPLSTSVFNGFRLTGLALSGAITLKANAADAIDSGSAGGSVTVAEGGGFVIESDGNGNWYLISNTSPASATIPIRAWALWNGNSDGTGTLVASQNISSISNIGTGQYNIALSGGFTYSHGAAMETGGGAGGGNSTWGSSSADITGANPTFLLITNNPGGSGGERGNMNGFCTIIVVGE